MTTLAAVFGEEWQALSPCERELVRADFDHADCSAEEYMRRIYKGNLASYVRCLVIQDERDRRASA